MSCLCRARDTARKKWGRIHLVDRCLLIILGILMLQSGLNLFLAESATQEMNSIDIVIRTSAAGIFGYLISANFNQEKKRSGRRKSQGTAPKAAESAAGKQAVQGPVARIGFDTGGGSTTAVQPPQTEETRGPGREHYDRAQILIVAAVGIVSLCIILVYRNWFTSGASAAGTLTQFRDFVSGSVGFLISCTTSGGSEELNSE